MIDFTSEIRAVYIHEQGFTRSRLQQLVNNIYIPKLKVKSFASFLYGAETLSNHSNYKEVPEETNKIFSDSNRSREELILGIESSFDESAASFINSYGEIKANFQMTQWEQWEEYDGI